MKFMTVRWSTTWAKMKSAKARSGLICSNWPLLAGFTCSLRQTVRQKGLVFKVFNYLNMNSFHTSQNKRSHTRDEATKEGVERECSNQATVHKLYDARQQNVQKVCIYQLQFCRCTLYIVFIKLGNYWWNANSHFLPILTRRKPAIANNRTSCQIHRIHVFPVIGATLQHFPNLALTSAINFRIFPYLTETILLVYNKLFLFSGTWRELFCFSKFYYKVP